MEFLKSSKRRSLISELIYIVLNVALAVAILLLVLAIESPLPALALVLLSKWRIFAVRPRYWIANIQANLVDILVSFSTVVLLYIASGSFGAQLFITILYGVWLLVIKPRSKRTFIALQAASAVFLGINALMAVSYNWPAFIVVLAMWIIGFISARHVLSHYEEPHASFYSLVWGLVMAEIGWLVFHWTFAYQIPGFGNLKLAQAAIIATALSFLAETIYGSYQRNKTVRSSDIILPVLLSVSLVLILALFFNTLSNSVI